jgi:hypothetical protein
MNVFQQPHEEESIRRVVHTRMAQFVWDYRMWPNLRALTIYLELVFAFENKVGRFDEWQCEDDDVYLFSRTWVHGDWYYQWLKGLINPLLIEH